MAASIQKISPTKQLARVRATAALRRVTDAALTRRHTVAVTVLAAGVGFYERGGKNLPTFVEGVPAKLQLAVIAAVVADHSSGEVAQYARAMCDGMAAIVGYQFGRGETVGGELAGVDSVVDV